MKSLKKLTLRPAVIVLTLAAALTVAARCDTASTACAAAAVVATVSAPEPITDGSYKDGSYEEAEAPELVEDEAPEPVEDGSYKDGSEDEPAAQDDDSQDNASDC